ncbi:MAG: hypothetical protein ASARMPRED_008333 [Alectoria sarmentosa]|nr:MAG: hypothetical protein ASARMPRED_008333 [Alectoria sarmentosa]
MVCNSAFPLDLEATALRKFDSLVEKGEILYERPRTSIFQFDITPALTKKPILPPDDPGRSKPIGPFVDPPEEWILARLGQSHKLILNKYCVYRPMLILHTTLFVPQTNDLDESDLTAAWAILRQMETPQMIIYNCDVETSISGVPFMHFVVRLPEQSSAEMVHTQYERLLGMTKDALKIADAGTDYNLILVSEWMVLIPRRKKGWGPFIANAANMVGSLWLRSEEQRDEMLEQPLLDMLAELGIPLKRI